MKAALLAVLFATALNSIAHASSVCISGDTCISGTVTGIISGEYGLTSGPISPARRQLRRNRLIRRRHTKRDSGNPDFRL